MATDVVPATGEYKQHLERGCACERWPDCEPHGAKEFGGGEPDICLQHPHKGPVVDWHAVASELAPETLAEWEAVVARHTRQGIVVEDEL